MLPSLVLGKTHEIQIKIPFVVFHIRITHSQNFLLKRTAVYLKMWLTVMFLIWF